MPEMSSRSQVAPEATSHVHLSQRAYVALRAMAMSYRFQPGQRLNEGELARELEISRTPLREAMHRLVSEGLLALVSGRGFFARPLEVKEVRSEEHTSELQSLMRSSYAVFCLKKKNTNTHLLFYLTLLITYNNKKYVTYQTY